MKETSMSKNYAGFTPAMNNYAFGLSDQYPDLRGISKKIRDRMNELRKAHIRNLLKENPRQAYTLPDFHLQLAEEITLYCKRELRKELFSNWDEVIKDAPKFFALFNRISSALSREYQDEIENNLRPRIKHRYLSITAKRTAFTQAIQSPKLLGELELACWGQLRYGLP